ncbi:MAG TPA: farnesyl diphosphate synthase [Pirellulales bacterium]
MENRKSLIDMGVVVSPMSSAREFLAYAAEVRPRIEAALDHFTQIAGDCPSVLTEALRYSLLDGGKRLRPLLVLMASDACSGDETNALPAACAVEMIHAYSLVHDDLPAMDDDDLRRGKPTNHKVFGEAMAILAGDGLLTLAFEVLAKHVQPSGAAARCCAILAHAAGVSGMVGGQASDILGAQTANRDLAEQGEPARAAALAALESMHARKTGALLAASLELGATTAEADFDQRHALDVYGKKLGLAFQIVDDLLDVQGDPAVVGKRVGKDSQLGKLTFPGLLGIDASRGRAERLIAEAQAALAPFGSRAGRLEALAQYVLERDS